MATRYIVHGVDESGQSVRKFFEAGSAGEAERQAKAIGMQVRAVEVDPASFAGSTSPLEDPLPSGGRRPTPMGPEQTVWTDTPSQWPNAGWFALGILILPLPWAIWKYVTTRCTKITVTTERMRIQTGVFSKVIEEIELYRVKDTQLIRTFWQRMVGLGTITMMTSDVMMPKVELAHIRESEAVREHIRKQVETVRRARGVRELDVAESDHLLN
jgi:membrane protein YdbS with pleckstrin-like domain